MRLSELLAAISKLSTELVDDPHVVLKDSDETCYDHPIVNIKLGYIIPDEVGVHFDAVTDREVREQHLELTNAQRAVVLFAD